MLMIVYVQVGHVILVAINSLSPGRFSCILKLVIFQLISRWDILRISCEITLRPMPLDLTKDESTLVQVMAWCRQAASHYLQPILTPNLHHHMVLNKPQWVNGTTLLVQYICPSETCKFHLQVPIFKRVACRDLTIWQGDLHNSPNNGLYVTAAWNMPILSASAIFLV